MQDIYKMSLFMKYRVKHLVGAFILALLVPCSSMAQSLPAEKQKAYLEVNYIKEDTTAKVHFKLYTKEGYNKIPVRFTIVNLFLNEESKWGMMGNITTDSGGEGAVPLRDRFAKASNSMTEFHLIGSAKDDPRLAETQTEITIRPAMLSLTLYQQDSVRYAKATLKQRDSLGNWVPVQGIKVDFYVQKYFTLLPSSYTDESGQALLEIPNGLKGDENGRTMIVAHIDVNEKYGSLIATAEEKWGVPDKQMGLIEKLLSITIAIGVWVFILSAIAKLFRNSASQSARN